ncbi:MAG: hypothetical protein IJ211_02565 [Campylobacter sp.]|nr:hypothetical protein [Campylobacter sp.]
MPTEKFGNLMVGKDAHPTILTMTRLYANLIILNFSVVFKKSLGKGLSYEADKP